MYLPEQVESGLGREEQDFVTTAVEDLANPEPNRRLEVNMQRILTSNVQKSESMQVKMVLKKRESDFLLNLPISTKVLCDISRPFNNRK